MITVESDGAITEFTVLSKDPVYQDIKVIINHDEDVLSILQYEHPDDEDDDEQVVMMRSETAYALYGILKATLTADGKGIDEDALGRLSARS